MSDTNKVGLNIQDEELFARIEKALDRKGQVILYGPPGTGKTYSSKQFIEWKQGKEIRAYFIVFREGERQSYKIFVNGEITSQETAGSISYFINKPIIFLCEYENSKIICNGTVKIIGVKVAEETDQKSSFQFIKDKHFNHSIDLTDVFKEESKSKIIKVEAPNNSIRFQCDESQLKQIIQKLRDQSEPAVESLKTVEMCTFHPSYTYEDFIEGYKPTVDSGNVTFALQDGLFKRFCSGSNFNFPHYFIIDEINRGNVPKVFGELITLLEKDKRGDEVILPYSKQPFSIPASLNLIGTMNTSDRSIKTMDAAFKRRFAFIEVMPDYSLIDQPIAELIQSPGQILKKLNMKLIEKIGRDKQIGHAYFMKGVQQVTTVEELRDIFDMDIIPLVQEYCHNDYKLLGEIVGAEFVLSKWELNRSLFDGETDSFINAIRSQFGSQT